MASNEDASYGQALFRCHRARMCLIWPMTPDSKAKFVMMFCQVVKDSRTGRSLAAEKRAEFEAQGWLASSPPTA